MGNFVLKGHVSYATKRKYKWVAEFGKNTCEKCAALDGQIFDEEDVPYWPHPNCKCKVEEISVIDEIDAEIHEYKEEIEQLKLQANELLGDVNVLQEQVEKLLRETRNNEVNALNNKLSSLACDIYKLIDKIDSLNKDTVSKYIIDFIEQKLRSLNDNELKAIKELIDWLVNNAEKIRPDLYDGAGFWQIASNPDMHGKEYLEKENAMIANTLNDLESQSLKDFINSKLKSQKMSPNTVGIIYDKSSSVSKAISNSQEFRTFIHNNKTKLIDNKIIDNSYLYFSWYSNLNLNLALRRIDVIDIHLDSHNTLYAKVVDTYDFNYGEVDPKIIIPRILQEKGHILPYYDVIQIEVPENDWKFY